PLLIQRGQASGSIILNWGSTACQLQKASTPIGQWTTVPGAAPPFTTVAGPGQAYFRTVNGPACSPNVVGYVTLTLSTSAATSIRHLIANPLFYLNNDLNSILPLPDTYDGTTISRLDTQTQQYRQIQFVAGRGWVPDDSISPGEGFFIAPVGPSPLSVIFIGEVPQGTLMNPLPP